MDNVITIILKDARGQDPKEHRIDFESNPTLSELVAAKLIIDEVLEHNFTKADILLKQGIIYQKIENIEEIRRSADENINNNF